MITFKVAIAAVVVTCAPAFAGPEWVEQGDAGSLPGGAQVVSGNGSLGKISGVLDGALNVNGEADFIDMFLIYIDDPLKFSATTTILNGGGAQFDSQMWLFKVDGFGLLGNDDTFIPGGPGEGNGTIVSGSTLGPAATDQTGVVISEPGTYLLAISNQYMVPASPGGPICLFASPTEISGPDGQGGTQPISFWQNTSLTGAPTSGTYSIALTGTSLVPAPSSAVALLVGVIGLRGRRRRK